MSNAAISHADTKEQLILAGRSLFAANGYDGTTVRDIADQAEVNVSLVSYHFGGKKGLYEACLGGFREEGLLAIQRILQNPDSIEDFRARFRLHAEETLSWYAEYPEVMQMVHREIDRGTPIVEDFFKDTLMKALAVIQRFLRVAKKKGYLRSDLDPKLLSRLVGTSMHQLGQSDPISEKFFGLTLKNADYRKKVVSHLLTVFFEGMTSEMKSSFETAAHRGNERKDQ